jgi:hypothetical protein
MSETAINGSPMEQHVNHAVNSLSSPWALTLPGGYGFLEWIAHIDVNVYIAYVMAILVTFQLFAWLGKIYRCAKRMVTGDRRKGD